MGQLAASACAAIFVLQSITAIAQAQGAAQSWPGPDARRSGRTIVLGFDGMDPVLARRWMDEGKMPNFRRLAEHGSFQPLPTTNPPQSPVAWASFATGMNPGAHGLFDFLTRNADTYAPEYGIAHTRDDGRKLEFFGLSLPLSEPTVVNARVGKPFWSAAEEAGLRASVLRVPVTFPPDDITRMLSGMGVPDLLGTQGTFTYYSTRQVKGENTRAVKVTPKNGRVETVFEGPLHPLYQAPKPLGVPLVIESAGNNRVKIDLDGVAVTLAPGEWSGWVPLRFSVAWIIGVPAMVRLHLVRGFPDLALYVSPIQIDPRDPVQPISSPPEYAAALAESIGRYHTIGMPEETWSLNEGFISDKAYLDMVRTILAENEAMLYDTLKRKDSDLVVVAFVQTDRVSHMFYRGFDEGHPLYATTSKEARGAIEWIYREADRIVGKTLGMLGPEDRLIILSDHGFSTFRRSVHLNRWLAEQAFMSLKPGQPASESLFANVDWTRTKAYAAGLNGIYVNLKGRERLGIVRAGDVAKVKREIAEKLEGFVDPVSGLPVVIKVYDTADIYKGGETGHAPDLVIGFAAGFRASWQTALGGVPAPLIEDNRKNWSGDHCIDPSLVPGVLFTSFRKDASLQSIAEVPGLIRDSFARIPETSAAPASGNGSDGTIH